MNKKTQRKRLRDELGKLHFKILISQRGKICEICRRRPAEGRFHILTVGNFPALEFCDENVLLACWFPCHYSWHHDIRKAKRIEEIIKHLRGNNYEDKLMIKNLSMPKHSLTYLNGLLIIFKRNLLNKRIIK